MNVVIAPPGENTIQLLPMRQTAEAKVHSEDWTGVTGAKERRKLQNRLNQRARRRRLRQRNDAEGDAPLSGSQQPEEIDQLAVTLGALHLVSREGQPQLVQGRGRSKPFLLSVGDAPSSERTLEQLRRQAEQAYFSTGMGSPAHGSLTTIVRFNVFDGLARNAALLRIGDEWLMKRTTSKFYNRPASSDTSLPPNMVPTPLQRSTPHHPWIDLLPSPRMRDNFLIAAHSLVGTVDEDLLCRDIVDVGAGHGVEHAALIVWGDAWDQKRWEATEGFINRWGWLLAGCPEILEGTNARRRERGLKTFQFKV
ncbi:uncharacterized protein F5Z01DRAFT_241096 [Emericellopsis atlantica]|uniref:BZIP domain-containing protein n=1 Tax=Emericellopsis atlantica TaxID=2614577 RepID=A0A9P7ZHN8_9HYPO|nr:uncharacterized protein F5Z01DRAFT_241096 [Emericellopsis atlantica]KAG9252304.1 hypothetical protein F5Z01DRAFT_241096 [Emericellopsis atlantica]